MMECVQLLLLFVFAFVDISVATLTFYVWGQHVKQINIRIPYGFAKSTIEFWFCALVRSSMLVGAVIGRSWNKTDSQQRLQYTWPASTVIAVLMMMFAVVKMLAYTEVNSSSASFWCQFAWMLIASVSFHAGFVVLRRIRNVNPVVTNTTINSDNGEQQPLLSENQTEEISSETTNKKKMSVVLRLLSYSKPDAHLIIVAFLFMVISAVLEIFTPLYTSRVIQGIAIDKSEAVFVNAIIWMSVLSAASSISAGIRGGFFKVSMARLNIRVRNYLFGSLIQQEIGFFDVTKTGDITSRLTSDTTTMSNALSLNFNVFIRSFIKAVGVCIFMFKLSWRLSMITVVGLPVIMAISKVYGEFYGKLSKNVQDSLARANEVAEEVFSSMRTIRSFANESEEVSRYADKLDVTYKLKLKESVAYTGYLSSNQLFSLSLVVATLYYGGHLVMNDLMSGGDLVAFVLYQMELGFALESISDVFSGLMQAVGASEKVFEYIDRKPEIALDSGMLEPDRFCGRIQFRNVCFSYPGRPDAVVLKDMSFHVEPGEVVALVGPSGGGKSSCVSLLEHFYEPQQGQVLIDNVSISHYSHKFLHRQIALVGQEPVLFSRSLKDNITYGLGDLCDEEQLCRAAVLSNAHDFITEMSNQYDTQAGEKGLQLSGGQKQRIAIARAVIRNPSILLLDEATSALDSESEHLVQQAIYANLKGRTVLIIAHRLSTIERADRIIVINGGTVIEQGRHLELIQNTDGLYSRLVQRQMLATNLGLVDEISNCGTDQPSSKTSFLSAMSTSSAIPISKRLSENSDGTVKLSLPNLLDPPVSDGVKNGSHVSPKYGSIA